MTNVPSLRFQEFHEGWTIKKLGQLSKLITKGTTPSSIGFNFIGEGINFIKTENIEKSGFINIKDTPKISEECNKKLSRSILEEGDILFSIAGTLGRTCIIEDKHLPANTNQALAIIRLDSNTSKKYINQYLNLDKIKRYVDICVSVGAQPNINLQQVSDIRISLPSVEEQEKIASFFSLIDKKIELQTEKVEELKNYKKGIMQKIFSQELRFKDENGNKYPEWEERKLEDFIVEYKEKTTVDNQYPVLTSSRNGLMLQTDYFKDRQVTTEENIGYHIIPRGYITFRSRSDDTTFKFNQNNLIDKGIISYFYPVFYFNESLNDMYALYFMNNYLGCQIRREIVGTSQLVLSLNKLKQLKIPVPCIEEQNKIGKLVDNLENKILQEQNKLNYFTRYKKGLLQQMFI